MKKIKRLSNTVQRPPITHGGTLLINNESLIRRLNLEVNQLVKRLSKSPVYKLVFFPALENAAHEKRKNKEKKSGRENPITHQSSSSTFPFLCGPSKDRKSVPNAIVVVLRAHLEYCALRRFADGKRKWPSETMSCSSSPISGL